VEQAVARSRIEESGILPTLLGVAALLIGATTVFGQMQFSLNNIWGVAARPNRSSLFMLVKSRLLSLTVVLAIGFVLLVSLLLGVVLRAVLHFTHQFVPAVAALLSGTELLLSLVAVWLLFCAIFKVLPDVVLHWRDVLVGALVTALLFSIGRYAICRLSRLHRHSLHLRRGGLGGADPAVGLLLVVDPVVRRRLHQDPSAGTRAHHRAVQFGCSGQARTRDGSIGVNAGPHSRELSIWFR
jgi:membrane protein